MDSQVFRTKASMILRFNRSQLIVNKAKNFSIALKNLYMKKYKTQMRFHLRIKTPKKACLSTKVRQLLVKS